MLLLGDHMATTGGLRAAAIGGTCALLGLVVGCGDDSGDPASQAETAASSAQAPSGSESSAAESSADEPSSGKPSDECTWISTDDVTEAVGQPMEVSVAEEAACMFGAVAEDGPSLSLWVTAIEIDQKEYEEGSKDACDDVTELDVDDAGWTCEALGDPQGSVVKDKFIVTIDPSDFASDDEAYAALEKLIPTVTFP